MNTTRAALAAAIALAVSRGYFIADQIRVLTLAGPSLLGLIVIPIDILLLAPLPLLLFLMYRDRVVLTVSIAHKRLALAMAALVSAVSVAPDIFGSVGVLSRNLYEIRTSPETLYGAKIWHWLSTSNAGWYRFWNPVSWLSLVAFVFFLLALLHKRDAPGDPDAPRSNRVRMMAAATAILGGLSLLWGIGQFINMNIRWNTAVLQHPELHGLYHNPVRQFLTRWLPHSIPSVCWMLAAYIVYRSVPAAQPAPAAE